MDQTNLRKLLYLETNEKIDEDLVCMICLEVVVNPLECEDCERLFCS
jgi:hypothetical protein